MRNNSLSVIIVTKNRAALLRKALYALIGQCRPGDEIIVVDASSDDTPRVVASFTDRLPINYIRFTPVGFPLFYNKGARVARGDILVFYDDDCIASPTFLRMIRLAHRRHRDTLIQGMTYSIPRGNIYVDIMGEHYQHWLDMMRLSDGKLKVFDSKNASIPRALFWKLHGLSVQMAKGSEDLEFGLRLRRNGYEIRFDRSIVAYHHERSTLRSFLRQHARIAQSEGTLDAHIPKEDRLGMLPRRYADHIRSFWIREAGYVRQRQLWYACLLPMLYFCLACIRIWGYVTNRLRYVRFVGTYAG